MANLDGDTPILAESSVPKCASTPNPDQVAASTGDVSDVHIAADEPDEDEACSLDRDKTPSFITVGGNLPEAVDFAEGIIVERRPSIYQRGGDLVRTIRHPMLDDHGPVQRAAGVLVIVPLKREYLIEELTRLASWTKWDARSKQEIPINCPINVATTLLARNEWPDIPVLKGIIHAPTMLLDGRVIDQTGYDDDAGLIYDPAGTEFSPVPKEPSREEALAALDVLRWPYKDFPFESEADEAVVLSAILTGLVRRSLPTAPMHGISATSPGSGKTLLSDTVGMIVTGKVPTKTVQVKDQTEQHKALFSMLLAGDSIILIDNCTEPVEGRDLCAILTTSTFKSRILGESRSSEVPTSALFLATGNNLTFKGDMARRAIICELDPKREHPEEREFDVDLSVEVPRRRPQHVCAGLTILRAYHVAGRPKQQISAMGSFEAWSDLVRSALVWVGMPDPCETRARIQSHDPEKEQLGALLQSWHALFGKTPTTVKGAVEKALAEAGALPDPDRAPLREAIEAVAAERDGSVNRKRLGWFLRSNEGRIVGGTKFERAGEGGGSVKWCAVASGG